MQTNGKILAGVSYGVYVNGPQSLPTQFSDLFRINSNGTSDNSFSGDGKLELGQGIDNFQEIHILPDGKLRTLSGYVRVSQIDAEGNLDADFATGGQVVAGSNSWRHMAIDAAGRSVVTDNTSTGILRRFLTDGTSDIKFGRLGVALANSGSNYTYMSRIGITDSGDLVIAGLAGEFQKQLILTKHFGKRKL